MHSAGMWVQECTFILYRPEISGRLRRWCCLNRFTLFITSSPTFVVIFVCGMMGRFLLLMVKLKNEELSDLNI
jgi:hypothetical protein